MQDLVNSLYTFWTETGVYKIINSVNADWWQTLVMFAIVGVLVYLAIRKGFEPLLLLPIAIGMLLTNLPGGELFHSEYWFCNIDELNGLIKPALAAAAEGANLADVAKGVLEANGPIVGGHMVPWEELYSFTYNAEGLVETAYTDFGYIFQHGGLVGLHVMDEHIVQIPVSQNSRHIFKEGLGDSLVHRVKQNRFLVQQDIGVIGNAIGYGVHALKHGKSAVISADPGQAFGDFSRAMHMTSFPII